MPRRNFGPPARNGSLAEADRNEAHRDSRVCPAAPRIKPRADSSSPKTARPNSAARPYPCPEKTSHPQIANPDHHRRKHQDFQTKPTGWPHRDLHFRTNLHSGLLIGNDPSPAGSAHRTPRDAPVANKSRDSNVPSYTPGPTPDRPCPPSEPGPPRQRTDQPHLNHSGCTPHTLTQSAASPQPRPDARHGRLHARDGKGIH